MDAAEKTPKQKARLMIDSYRSSFIDIKSNQYYENGAFDLIKFWVDNSESFTLLAKVALWILACPVASVASESCFSRAGYMINPRRMRLIAKNVNHLIVVSSFS